MPTFALTVTDIVIVIEHSSVKSAIKDSNIESENFEKLNLMFASDLEKHELIDFLTESPTKEIFHHENEAEYLHAVGKVTQAVKKFLNNNQQPFSGVSPAQLKPLFENKKATLLGDF